jgi:hypothetical protein
LRTDHLTITQAVSDALHQHLTTPCATRPSGRATCHHTAPHIPRPPAAHTRLDLCTTHVAKLHKHARTPTSPSVVNCLPRPPGTSRRRPAARGRQGRTQWRRLATLGGSCARRPAYLATPLGCRRELRHGPMTRRTLTRRRAALAAPRGTRRGQSPDPEAIRQWHGQWMHRCAGTETRLNLGDGCTSFTCDQVRRDASPEMHPRWRRGRSRYRLRGNRRTLAHRGSGPYSHGPRMQRLAPPPLPRTRCPSPVTVRYLCDNS